MKLPKLNTRIIPSDPYRSVVLYDGALILAECNGSGKQEVADEIALRCNLFPALLESLQKAVDSLEWAKAVIGDISAKSEYIERLNEAEAIIAKAGGKA